MAVLRAAADAIKASGAESRPACGILKQMLMLEGQVVWITGAKGGLGSAVTRAFLDQGAQVVGTSRSIAASDFAHPRFEALAAPLETAHAAGEVVAEILRRHGRLDALVHLVGGFASAGRVEETGLDVLEQMLDVNLRAAFSAIQAVLPCMRRQNRGRIIAIGSRAAIDPIPAACAYNIAKAGLVALIQTVAKETRGTAITANAVLPGTIDTPANRAAMPQADPSSWVQPEQVANLIVFLASPQAAQINGALIPVYG